jgi:diguanylate cyclase (GGDEF)-like protein
MSDRILIVDDDPGAIQLMGRILAGVAKLGFATNGPDAIRLMRESRPDLVLLDAEMPGMSGFKVFDAMMAAPELSDISVIFVTAHSEPPYEISAFKMGAVDFIAKPVRAQVLLARVKTQLRIKRMADELRRTATLDGLTGVGNRRFFDEVLEREWQRARRHGNPLALLLIDVDHFKLYNDRYGHPGGDACLKKVADALTSTVHRTGDFVARCGGEEFSIILPQTGRIGAERVAQRVLDAVRQLAIPHAGSPTAHHVTVSVGVASYDLNGASRSLPPAGPRFNDALRSTCTESQLVVAADKALYAAKRGGRAQAQSLDVGPSDVTESPSETGLACDASQALVVI